MRWKAGLMLLVACGFALPAMADPPVLSTCPTPDGKWTLTSLESRPFESGDCGDFGAEANLCIPCEGGTALCQVWAIKADSTKKKSRVFAVLVEGSNAVLGASPSARIGGPCNVFVPPGQSTELGKHSCHETRVEWNVRNTKHFMGEFVTFPRAEGLTTAAVKPSDTQACALTAAGSAADPGQGVIDTQVGTAGDCKYRLVFVGNKLVDVRLLEEDSAETCTRVPVEPSELFVTVDGDTVPFSSFAESQLGWGNVLKTNEDSCYWFRTATGQMIGIGNPTCP